MNHKANMNSVTGLRWTAEQIDGRRYENGARIFGKAPSTDAEHPLVSVITVCRNAERTISQTIASVRNQTYESIEYIIIDGCSEDSTVEVIDKNIDIVDYAVSEPDQNLYDAMNKGLSLSQGQYIIFLNADDWFEPDTIECLVKAVNYSGCHFVSALARYVDDQNGRSYVLRSMPFNHSLYLRMSLRHETMLVSSDIYEQIGPYDKSYPIIADWKFAADLFRAGFMHYEVPRPLLNFRVDGVSNTHKEALATETRRFVKEQFPFLEAAYCDAIADSNALGPEPIIEAAIAHIDKSDFVIACRALLLDRKTNAGGVWRDVDISRITDHDRTRYPKVSVVLPYYRAEDMIAQCLDSVLNQDCEEIEVLCVNDMAVDGTEAVVEAYAAADSRIRHLRNEQNLGHAGSRNVGIKAARGDYILHLDPDDSLRPGSIRALYEAAVTNASELVKGAYRSTQGTHGASVRDAVTKYPCGVSDRIIEVTNLSSMPKLLGTTEGHWSYLYQADFLRAVMYPPELRMGEDSLFVVKALVKAKRICLIPEVVYNYQANPESAMNVFSARKCFDALDWRRRSWQILCDYGHDGLADFILFTYWGEAFAKALDEQLLPDERSRWFDQLLAAFEEADYFGRNPALAPRIQSAIERVASEAMMRSGKLKPTSSRISSEPLKVATLVARDRGGAGVGSIRRVEALRSTGVDARILCGFKETRAQFVHPAPLEHGLPPSGVNAMPIWRNRSWIDRRNESFLKASELFSRLSSIVDTDKLAAVLAPADIIHLHWITGLMDLNRLGELAAGKPVAWTLADMNAFTGGCHYSEGCENFQSQCEICPLLSGGRKAHVQWERKKAAYAQLPVLHIICPSRWMAEQVERSSLLGDRPVHVIPNAMPVDRFTPTDKIVARCRLGLPLNKKLVLFGADNLTNQRKGGPTLEAAVSRLRRQGAADGVEFVFFGANTLDVGMPSHAVGRIEDEEHLSLVYAACDVFAFPSREDNAPLTVGESLLSGTPVVAFPIGNVPDLVHHLKTGYLARFDDVDDFAAGLAWALSAPRSRQAVARSMQCRMVARAYHDPDTCAARHVAVYEQMIEEAARLARKRPA